MLLSFFSVPVILNSFWQQCRKHKSTLVILCTELKSCREIDRLLTLKAKGGARKGRSWLDSTGSSPFHPWPHALASYLQQTGITANAANGCSSLNGSSWNPVIGQEATLLSGPRASVRRSAARVLCEFRRNWSWGQSNQRSPDSSLWTWISCSVRISQQKLLIIRSTLAL